jgi:hypothetical protein
MMSIENITLLELRNADSVDELKIYGAFYDVKKHINNNIGLQIKSRSWKHLLALLKALFLSFNENRELFLKISLNVESLKSLGKFNDVKRTISDVLGFRIYARSWFILYKKIVILINALTIKDNKIDAYTFYEKNKKANFLHSSKLEGINIKSGGNNMEDVLKKHRVSL